MDVFGYKNPEIITSSSLEVMEVKVMQKCEESRKYVLIL